MTGTFWARTIAPVAIAAVLCATTGVRGEDKQAVRHEGHHGSVGYHYQNPAQYHHAGRAYRGSDYVASPTAYYRYGHTTPNYYRTYGYGSTYAGYGGYGYGSYGGYAGYGYGYGNPPVVRPTWYEGLTRRDLTTGETTTWSPLQYNTAGYYVGNYGYGAAYGSNAYGYSYGCGYANCGGCNVCGYTTVQPQPQPTLQWRTMSTDKATRDAQLRREAAAPVYDPCEVQPVKPEPCERGEAHEHKRDRDRHDAKRDDDRREDDKRKQMERRRRMERERDKDREREREREERRDRARQRSEGEPVIERKQIELGHPDPGTEWMEPGPQVIRDDEPHGRINLERREIVSGDDGWQMLREGDMEAAREWFSRRVMDEGKDAALQVGYALSSAATGRMATGVWAMRQALRLDPRVLSHIRVDRRLGGAVRDLIGRYRYAPSDLISESDGAYMAAALHYLLGELDYAATAINLAIERGGDDDRSVLELREVIEHAKRR